MVRKKPEILKAPKAIDGIEEVEKLYQLLDEEKKS
jgi:hypothetical protein